MEENKTNEMIEEIDTVDEVEIEVYDEPEEDNGVNVGAIMLFGGLAGLAALGIAKRKKIKEWFRRRQVNKLEKEGYVIFAPGDERHLVTDEEDSEVYDSDEE